VSVSSVAKVIEWNALETDLLDRGYSVIDGLCSPQECDELLAGYSVDTLFRKTVVMARHNFGSGEYKYFAYPLPGIVQQIRETLFQPLAKIANDWADKFARAYRWPEDYGKFLQECAIANQVKPTPLMLRYGQGDYNRLHQDMYGEVYFPFQVIVLLSEPQLDFEGGDLVLMENYPRMQSRPHVPKLRKGSAVIIPSKERPIPGVRGWRQAQMRHGVSEIVKGQRYTLGIIFHDAA
jgi:hypothetical protein